jgi:hypothetical protein
MTKHRAMLYRFGHVASKRLEATGEKEAEWKRPTHRQLLQYAAASIAMATAAVQTSTQHRRVASGEA